MAGKLMHEKEQLHELVDRLAPSQVHAVHVLLRVMLDPVSRAIASAPVDDEPLTAEDAHAHDEAREWLKGNQPIPHERVLAELGITTRGNRELPGTGVKRIAWTEQAKADIRDLDKPTAMRIPHALHRSAESGARDIKSLQGGVEEFWLRVGGYRLFFVLTGEEVIEIHRVRHRREAYRRSGAWIGSCTFRAGARTGSGRQFRPNGWNCLPGAINWPAAKR
jgi:mRNA-degrading endonuclease RelE of RelBE toxin-antitoxin system